MENFGLKLNYSVVIEGGSDGKDLVRLKKRIKKSEIKVYLDQKNTNYN